MMKMTVMIIMVIFFLGGCAKTPVTNRNQFMMMSPDQEMSIGASESQKIKKSSKLSTDKALQDKIKHIGQKIAAVSGRSDYAWEFNVIESNVTNAFCLPGGKVFFYTGILKITQNDDQIAAVMGHEIAHALARHGAERASMQSAGNLGAQVLGVALGIPKEYQGLYAQVYGVTSQVGLILPYSRRFEHEADQIGVHLMVQAGYNPYEAIKFWENMKKASTGDQKPPAFLSTHPADDERISAIRDYVAKMPKQ
jgi:predicted Zn-dependent protease